MYIGGFFYFLGSVLWFDDWVSGGVDLVYLGVCV